MRAEPGYISVEDGESKQAVCGLTQHPQYDGAPQYNYDLAILHLCQPLTFSRGKLTSKSGISDDTDLTSDDETHCFLQKSFTSFLQTRPRTMRV